MRDSDEPRWRPSRRRVVDPDSLECDESHPQVGDARMVDYADLSFGSTVPAGLCALEDARSVLVERVDCDEAHLGRKADRIAYSGRT